MSHGLRCLPWMGIAIFFWCTSAFVGCGTVATDDDDATGPVGDDDTVTPTTAPTPTQCPDADGDGSCVAEDCDDANPAINPSATEVCEAEHVDNNCDGIEGCAYDDDGDCACEADSCTGSSNGSCGALVGGDCNDLDAAIGPNATEVCYNTVDEDCDGVEGNGCPYVDDDGDGLSEDQEDCDDTDPSKYPGADERFDGIDNNCDGFPEESVTLSPSKELTFLGTEAYQNLGWSVAGIPCPIGYVSLNGDEYPDLLIGAPGYGGMRQLGAAQIYFGGADFGGPTNPAPQPIILSESQAEARAGWSVAAIGDLDLDLKMDIAVGAPGYDTKNPDAGKIYIIKGKSEGWISAELNKASDAEAPGMFENDLIGYSLAGGSVNGDNYSDLLVGAPNPTNGGYMMVIPGSPTFDGTILKNLLSYANPEGSTDMNLGQSIAYVGDIHGDGLTSLGDIVVSGTYSSAREGVAVWVPGSTAFEPNSSFKSLDAINAVLLKGAVAGENLGWSISGNGDINGDGYKDFMVADEANKDTADPVAFIFLGGPSFLDGDDTPATYDINTKADIKVKTTSANVCPCAVAINGDVNGDGYSDILIGTSGDATVYLILGKANFPLTLYLDTATADYVFHGADQNKEDATGQAVAWISSINGDDYDDFVIGAPLADLDPTVPDAGAAYVLFGFPMTPGQ